MKVSSSPSLTERENCLKRAIKIEIKFSNQFRHYSNREFLKILKIHENKRLKKSRGVLNSSKISQVFETLRFLNF